MKTFCYGGSYHGRKLEISGNSLVIARPGNLRAALESGQDAQPFLQHVETYSLTKVQNHDWYTNTREYVWVLLLDGKDYDPLKIFNMGKRYKLVVRV